MLVVIKVLVLVGNFPLVSSILDVSLVHFKGEQPFRCCKQFHATERNYLFSLFSLKTIADNSGSISRVGNSNRWATQRCVKSVEIVCSKPGFLLPRNDSGNWVRDEREV